MRISEKQLFNFHFLDKYELYKKFVWKEVMPEDEIWVKLGGDMGGGSFKLCFQIANLEKPNSVDNTIVFCCFGAPLTP